MSKIGIALFTFALTGSASALFGQPASGVVPAEEGVRGVRDLETSDEGEASNWELSETYLLLPGDQVRISVQQLTDSYPQDVLIGEDGSVTLPLAGRVEVAGLTLEAAQARVAKRFQRMIHEPHVGITLVKSARVIPISVLGAVNKPGMYKLAGRRTVLEVLALAGGIAQDAGYRVRVSRPVDEGSLNVEGAELDATGEYAQVDLPLLELMEGLEPSLNFEVGPHDVISVPRGKMVYVLGAVQRGGGYVLAERQEISVLEVLALAGGFSALAKKKQVRILRSVDGRPQRREIPVNVKDMMRREGSEVYLQKNDILLVPESGFKKASAAMTHAAAGALPTALLWRFVRQ